MATLTIRKIPDEQIQQLKEVAEKNNRSMESQVRSILEEWRQGGTPTIRAKFRRFPTASIF